MTTIESLEERVREKYEFVFLKHQDEDGTFDGDSSPEEYADGWINGMSNTEFLSAISFALEEMLSEVKA